jgi:ABC-type Fe3+/spermidine/putrescine transport system ATPase subunit
MIPAVEITGLRKSFGDFVALHEINLSIKPKEFVSLLGASGCGKTTLLRIVAGFEHAAEGRVKIAGEDITDTPPHSRPTSIVFQRGALFPHMNVRENVGYSLKLRKWPRRKINNQVDRMLAMVRLEGYGDRDPSQLSGGQVQRVALARALAGEPRVLLLDEPFSALDLKLRQQMQLELRTLQRALGATFVFVTHDQTEALVMSDRIAIMNAGRIVQFGTPPEIYTRPASVFVSDFIGQANLLPGEILKSGAEGVLFRLHNGATMRAIAPTPLGEGRQAILSVRPENVRVEKGHAQGGAPGVVKESVYLGPRVRVAIALGEADLAWAELREAEAAGLAPGDQVTISWPGNAALILEEGTG